MNTAQILETPDWSPAPAAPLADARHPTVTEQMPEGGFPVVDLLLRDRGRYLQLLQSSGATERVARTLLITIAVSAAATGAAVGAFHGGIQVFYAALKLPLVVLMTTVVCAPALVALNKAVHGESRPQRDLLLVLSALALGTLATAGLAPLLLLATRYGVEYHRIIILFVTCCAIGGAVGGSLLLAGLSGSDVGGRSIVGATMITLLMIVGAQASWTFRPYLLRPAAESVPFMRGIEDNFLDSVTTSFASSRGEYSRSRR